MYAKNDLFHKPLLSDEQKREQTKKELKNLLTKYIGGTSSHEQAILKAKCNVKGAQHKIGVMSGRHEKAAEEMKRCNDHFLATRHSVNELETYKEIQKFNSIIYEKELMKKSRLNYGNPDSIYKKEIYTSTDAMEKAMVEKRRAELMAHLGDLQRITREKERDQIDKNLREFTRQQNDREVVLEELGQQEGQNGTALP